MIKNLITATMLATASPLMTASGYYRATATITTNGTPISKVVEGQIAEYYYIKEANQITPINGTNIKIKGYQYTKCEYQDAETGWYTSQIIDYYIKTDNTNANVSNYKYSLFGNLFNNSIESSINEYEIIEIENGNSQYAVYMFMNGTQTYDSLNTLKEITGTSKQYDDAGANYIVYQTTTRYTYLRIRLVIEFYTNDYTISDAVLATRDLYTELYTEIEITNTPTPGTNYEVIDLGGLMFEILGMPFAWASIAFNLTLFPGTPYAINISRLFFAILGSLILIIILKKVLK